MPRWCRSKRDHVVKNRVAAALESVLRLYADPIRKRLKVRSGLNAGGRDINHSRRLLGL